MKTKLFMLTLAALLMSPAIFAQDEKVVTEADFIKERMEKLGTNLVSNETFDNLIYKDFATIQTGDKNKNVVGPYATLDVNTKDKSFAFAPYVHKAGNLFVAAEFTGKLSNNETFFNWKNRSYVKIDLSLTWLFQSWKNYDRRLPDEVYRNLYSQIYKKVDQRISGKKIIPNKKGEGEGEIYESNLRLDDVEVKSVVPYNKTDSLKKLVIKYETLLAKQSWKGKTLLWTKLNVAPLSNDNFHYIMRSDSSSFKNPLKKNINMFSVQGSINIYRENMTFIYYGSFYLKGTRKHSLSEIYETKQWNKMRSLDENTYISEESKNIYELDNSQFSRLFLFDYGLQLIAISKKLKLGLELKYDNVKFIKPSTSNDVSRSDDFSAGIVIPLKNKEGKTSINITPFYEYKQYIGYEKASENIAGVKFSLPFGQ